MGRVTIRYLRETASGFYWEPSRKIRAMGFHPEALGKDAPAAVRRAKELNQAVEKAVGDAKEAEPGDGDAVGDVIKRYRASRAYTGLAARTRRGYDQCLDRIDRWAGDVPVQTVTRRAVKAWQAALEEKAPAFAAAILRVLRIVLGVALDEGLIEVNPALRLRLHVAGGKGEVWSPDEVRAFCQAATDAGHPSMALAVRLAYDTAQREGDVLRMARSAIDRAAGAVRVVQGKTGAVVEVPLSAETLDLIDATPMESPVLVIAEATGRPYREDHFRHLFAELRADAGLPVGRKFMTLRHTAASELAAAGASREQIKATTGHRSDAVLARYVRPDSASAKAGFDLRQRNKKRPATENRTEKAPILTEKAKGK